jgi:hypothetical protein
MARTSGASQPFQPGFRLIDGTDLNKAENSLGGSWDDGITATAGGTQATSLTLTQTISRITTVASAADGVKLPPMVPGQIILIINDAAANALQVFPQVGAKIDGVASATGVALSAAKRAWFICTVANVIVSGVMAVST